LRVRWHAMPWPSNHRQLGNGVGFQDYFDDIYPAMSERYGSWHGFGAMFVSNMVRDVIGETAGFCSGARVSG
jgi:hypothetical protein